MVYVPAAETYEVAVTHAFDVFAPQLRAVRREDISFAIHVKVQGETRCVRIGQYAWPTVLKSLVRYGLVDVIVAEPDVETSVAEPEPREKRSKFGDLLEPPPTYSVNEKGRSLSAPDLTLSEHGAACHKQSSFKRFVLGRFL